MADPPGPCAGTFSAFMAAENARTAPWSRILKTLRIRSLPQVGQAAEPYAWQVSGCIVDAARGGGEQFVTISSSFLSCASKTPPVNSLIRNWLPAKFDL